MFGTNGALAIASQDPSRYQIVADDFEAMVRHTSTPPRRTLVAGSSCDRKAAALDFWAKPITKAEAVTGDSVHLLRPADGATPAYGSQRLTSCTHR